MLGGKGLGVSESESQCRWAGLRLISGEHEAEDEVTNQPLFTVEELAPGHTFLEASGQQVAALCPRIEGPSCPAGMLWCFFQASVFKRSCHVFKWRGSC